MNKEIFLKRINVFEDHWLWLGAVRGKTGYGCAKYNKKVIDTHRLSWMFFKGEIPKGLLVCHTCDIKLCVNPDHLFLGTYHDNLIDSINKGRKFYNIHPNFKMGHIPIKSKLSRDQAKIVKERIKLNQSLPKLAKEFNVPYYVIRDIKYNRNYKNV